MASLGVENGLLGANLETEWIVWIIVEHRGEKCA
jgi:hypothetical protein